ncbi:Pc22g00340 [Penicillium rubens Wisconsin 54-1255]|uniref:Pc22g00340 protein n=1 Tax=Penicillium rubens (strain ATCC 28089 / DSM 1075 / NRRL 1951 / Wisconsin 54-1255) TaxID=500485 RepID=B6HPE8_PENRW|nr:Pc22g00340 [Penicillium rubens Wisconsin 54-1255]
MGQTPVLDQFLGSLQELVQNRDGAKVQDFLQLEPPLSDIYQRMVSELRQYYAPGSKADTELLQRCEPLVPRSKGGSWTAFPTFAKLYLIFLRDMNTDNLLETYNQLKALLNQCVLALGDSQMGVVVLPTVLYLSKCGKLRNAEQMFASISAQSPPLAYFPASQRVTYLYYLGRYLFANNLFSPARLALQAAYDQCHRQAISQRRLILSYLIPCNIILGRFPSQALLQRPEAQGLAEHFQPLCRLIVRGDYLAFRQHLFLGSPTAQWFARKGILFTLRNRCETLVWRSFARKVFMYGGSYGGPQAQAQKGPPPVLNLKKLVVAIRWLQTQHASSGTGTTSTMVASNLYGSQVVSEPTDLDYARLEGADGRASPATDREILGKYGDFLAPDGFYTEEGRPQPNLPGQLVDGDPEENYGDYELNPYAYDFDDRIETDASMMQEIESIFASLITQGLMGGYLLHREPRFAVPGAKIKGILPTGFPNVWQTISARESHDSSVPGWVQPRAPTIVGAAGGGRVVNLAGARPVGLQ